MARHEIAPPSDRHTLSIGAVGLRSSFLTSGSIGSPRFHPITLHFSRNNRMPHPSNPSQPCSGKLCGPIPFQSNTPARLNRPRAKGRLLPLIVGCFVLGCIGANVNPTNAQERTNQPLPNIVVLFSDDAGYADFGFQPNCRKEMQALTPNIDRIAREGLRCSNAYVSGCVCSPSRAGLMTGRYQERFGFDNNLPPGAQNGLSLKETFGAKRLQQLGYKTALIGKWHLGYPDTFHPNRRGWDWFYGLLQGSRSYYPYEHPTPHRVFLDNTTPTPEEGYVTDRIGDAACRFIAEQKDQPFFLFVSFTAPHGPLQPKKEDLARLAHIQGGKRKKYAGLILSLDDNVGKILKALAQHGLSENTLVVFTNDNGGQTKTGANNAPLRGRKGQLYEGGIRVPWAVRWPAKIKPGTTIDDPVIAIDLIPTFVAAAGGQVDPEWKLDGINLLPLWTGKVNTLPTRDLFWRKGGSQGYQAVREGEWKLYRDKTHVCPPELYHLSQDISEEHDVAADHPEIVTRLGKKLDQWDSELVPPLWGPGSPNDHSSKKKKNRKKQRPKQKAQ